MQGDLRASPAYHTVVPSPGKHCHSTLSLTVIGCHSLDMHTVTLQPLLPFSVKMTVSTTASRALRTELSREPGALLARRALAVADVDVPLPGPETAEKDR
jgi:hypothetical protein